MNQAVIAPQINSGLIPIFEELWTQNPRSRNLTLLPYNKLPVARNVIRKGDRNHHVGLFASRLNRALVPYESALEKDACVYFESRPEITGYISQPIKIKLLIDGKEKNVYPDFEIMMNDRKALIDIKHYRNTQKPAFIARTQAMLAYACNRNIGYSVITEKDIRTNRLDTVRWLISVARGTPSESLKETVYFWLQDTQKERTYEYLWRVLDNYPSVLSVVAGFILDGILLADLDQSLFQQKISIMTTERGS